MKRRTSTREFLQEITVEAQDRYTAALNRVGITSVSHAFRLLGAPEQGLQRFVAFVHYPEGDEQVDVDATNADQARVIAQKAVSVLYQPGSTGIDIEGPITATMYHM